MLSILSQLFVVERHRPRAGDVGHSVPALSEIEVAEGAQIEPLLVTNMRGTFLPTRVAKEGYIRHGYSECPPDQEGELLKELYRVLRAQGWGNVAPTLTAACAIMDAHGLTPKTMVQSSELPSDYEDGCGVKVWGSDHLPLGSALVVASPEAAGTYTRIGNHVGVVIQRADQTFVVVDDELG